MIRFLPARRAFLALAAAALLLAVVPYAGVAADAALLLLIALDAFLARMLGPPDLEMQLPSRLAQGDEEEARVQLRNRTGRTLHALLRLELPPALSAGPSKARRSEIGPGTRTWVEFQLLARNRGQHEIRALHLRLLGPLGLVWWQIERSLEHTVEVVPGLREVRSYRLLALHHHLQQAGLRNVRQRGEGGAFESLREYVRGDDTRHMDWKATARRRALIVRQYEAERSQNIVLCIDTGRLMAERVGQVERLDKALAAAVILSEVARVWDDHVGLLAFSDRVHAILPPGRYPPARFPSIFAGLESRAVEPDYPRALARLSRLVSRRSLLVFFGDVIDEEVSAPLAGQLAHLARRHLPLFIAIRNSDLFDAALAPVEDRRSAYLRASATELVLARARTLARMRERGIQVADVLPDAAVAAAVNRYLEIKRRGSL